MADSGRDADDQPDDERGEEARLVRPRLRHGRRARQHEQRGEHPEPDEVAEREVHDPGQPVHERVPGREEPVDATGRETGHEHLEA